MRAHTHALTRTHARTLTHKHMPEHTDALGSIALGGFVFITLERSPPDLPQIDIALYHSL